MVTVRPGVHYSLTSMLVDAGVRIDEARWFARSLDRSCFSNITAAKLATLIATYCNMHMQAALALERCRQRAAIVDARQPELPFSDSRVPF